MLKEWKNKDIKCVVKGVVKWFRVVREESEVVMEIMNLWKNWGGGEWKFL